VGGVLDPGDPEVGGVLDSGDPELGEASELGELPEPLSPGETLLVVTDVLGDDDGVGDDVGSVLAEGDVMPLAAPFDEGVDEPVGPEFGHGVESAWGVACPGSVEPGSLRAGAVVVALP